MNTLEWQSWLLDKGHEVLTKESNHGRGSLSTYERLIHCVWVADYGMTNAGDLEVCEDVHPEFREEAVACAKKLGLQRTLSLFSLSKTEIEETYPNEFEFVCAELSQLDGH